MDCAPGLSRGLVLSTMGKPKHAPTALSLGELVKALPQATEEKTAEPKETKDVPSEAIDALLPTHAFTFVPAVEAGKKKTAAADEGWARLVDAMHVPADWDVVVPKLAFEYPFELDPFQKQAVYHLERGESVFVAAHTSAGKTAVAEYAIALAQHHLTRCIYTSPIKALSNQKFRDFRQTFGNDQVGLLTGDVQLQPEAPCLIMTTEILRSMLYRGAEAVADVEFVIFDEVHYVNDAERGVVWEEVIIMLPPRVTLVMLSATIPNTQEFADWVGRTRQRPIYVISTLMRPVPLVHYLYLPLREGKKALEDGSKTKNAGVKTKSTNSEKKDEKKNAPPLKADRLLIPLVDAGRNWLEPGYREALARQRSKNDSQKSLAKPGMSTGAGLRNDRNLWPDVVYMLKKRSLLPAVIFTFSKKRCEENVDSLGSLDLTQSAGERSQIHLFMEASFKRLKGTDAELPQILRMKDLLLRGLAVHHSGLLPIVKEAVEMLFSRGLVRVLFATETFAMGVNMPARTVVFSSTRKHDGQGFRQLLAGEYTQMAGRAGRRGLDTTGTVIMVVGEEVPAETTLRTMILGQPTRLVSQFRLTYHMILNLLRVEAMRVEEMIKRSFSENANQRAAPEEQQHLEKGQAELADLAPLQCALCEHDLADLHSCSLGILREGKPLWEAMLKRGAGVSIRYLDPGRIIVITDAQVGNRLAIILKPQHGESGALGQGGSLGGLVCMIVGNVVEDQEDCFMPPSMVNFGVARRAKAGEHAIRTISPAELVMITQHRLKLDFNPTMMSNVARMPAKQLEECQQAFQSWLESSFPKAATNPSDIVNFAFSELEPPAMRILEVDEHRLNRASLLKQLPAFRCHACPDLFKHYTHHHRQQTLTERLAELRFKLSEGNLALLPEYHARVAVLKDLGYVDAQGQVQLKGRVACEIATTDELITTELLFANAFADCEPAEIIALLSSMVFQERHATEPKLEGRLLEGKERILETAKNLVTRQRELGVDVAMDQVIGSLHFSLVQVVHQWALGRPFKQITELTDVLEGSIVRCIVRLDETCRELRGAAKIMGDPVLYRKMEEASIMIKRDICFASSLYL